MPPRQVDRFSTSLCADTARLATSSRRSAGRDLSSDVVEVVQQGIDVAFQQKALHVV